MELDPDVGGGVPIPGQQDRIGQGEEEHPLLNPLNEFLDHAILEQHQDRQQVGEGEGLQGHQIEPEQDAEFEAQIHPGGANVRRNRLRDERPHGRETRRQVRKIRKAIIKGDAQKLNNLLVKHPNAINGSSRITLCPLEMANCYHDPVKRQALIDTILQHNPNLTVRDRVGNTILHRLSIGGHQALAEQILRHSGGGEELLHLENYYGRTPMQYAQIIGTPGMVRLYDPQGRAARPPPVGPRGHPPADRLGGPRPGDMYPAAELPPVPERMHPGELREGNLLHNVPGLNLGDDLEGYARRPDSVDTQDVLNVFDSLLLQGGMSAGRMKFDDSGRGFMDVGVDQETLLRDVFKLEDVFKHRTSQQFVFVPIALEGGRMASLICDTERREIEIFDPCGSGEEPEDWGEVLNALEEGFQDTNIMIVKSIDNPLSSAIDDSGPYVLLHAQSRLQHPELSAMECRETLKQFSEEISLNAENIDAEKQRIENYRKNVVGAAMSLYGVLHANAFNRRNQLGVSDEDWARVERDFKNRFPLTHESERLRLAHYNLTPYDLINETEEYLSVMAPKPLDEEPDVVEDEEYHVAGFADELIGEHVHPSQYSGLPNLENTCFLNGVVSQFIHNDKLDEALNSEVPEQVLPIQQALANIVEKARLGTEITRDDMEVLNSAVSSYPDSPITEIGQQDAATAFTFIMDLLKPSATKSVRFGYDGSSLRVGAHPETYNNALTQDGILSNNYYTSCGEVMRVDVAFTRGENRGEVTSKFRERYEKDGGLIFPEYECSIDGDDVVLTPIRRVRYELDGVGIALGESKTSGHMITKQRLPNKGGVLERNDNRCTHDPTAEIEFDESARFYVFNRDDSFEGEIPEDEREEIRVPLNELSENTKNHFMALAE